MLTFDDAMVKRLNRAYKGPDVTARRLANLRALDLRPGHHVLDLGCGQGLLTVDLAGIVGPAGKVLAIDPSPDMRKAATMTCKGLDQVAILEGDASAIPADSASLDRVIAVQVFEYVPDIDAALAEIARVLKPGGRVVLGNMLWPSFHWFSDDPDRMDRMCRLWEDHVRHTDLPAWLADAMARAGLAPDPAQPFPFVNQSLSETGLARMMLDLMANFARSRDEIATAEVDAWVDEQHALDAAGRFFWSLTHVIQPARKPG
ncbi:methyltransferase domain-containing protein [Oceanomicrobium pacificus]|uniref:Methyltransferase domain-containing protein n=1 Tax=Oceanomicrobium pacificus TaxID=2692916 RepID=A0A6B0TMX1_9RHOB|nr:methyltransferase domain-containing protein [Oceanomicrobium pacificus]MXU63919.1 methyltransferase domain-containing protein [Oceanomicrobium pacificus]